MCALGFVVLGSLALAGKEELVCAQLRVRLEETGEKVERIDCSSGVVGHARLVLAVRESNTRWAFKIDDRGHTRPRVRVVREERHLRGVVSQGARGVHELTHLSQCAVHDRAGAWASVEPEDNWVLRRVALGELQPVV
jgi:hypothetical protein